MLTGAILSVVAGFSILLARDDGVLFILCCGVCALCVIFTLASWVAKNVWEMGRVLHQTQEKSRKEGDRLPPSND